jgi:predicted phage tail protein
MPVAAAAEALHVQLPLFRRKFNEVLLRGTCDPCLAARDTLCSYFLEMSSPFATVRRGGARFCFW